MTNTRPDNHDLISVRGSQYGVGDLPETMIPHRDSEGGQHESFFKHPSMPAANNDIRSH